MSSMKARPACFCNEFCHSWEQSSITSSTTELLFLKVVRPNVERRESLAEKIVQFVDGSNDGITWTGNGSTRLKLNRDKIQRGETNASVEKGM